MPDCLLVHLHPKSYASWRARFFYHTPESIITAFRGVLYWAALMPFGNKINFLFA